MSKEVNTHKSIFRQVLKHAIIYCDFEYLLTSGVDKKYLYYSLYDASKDLVLTASMFLDTTRADINQETHNIFEIAKQELENMNDLQLLELTTKLSNEIKRRKRNGSKHINN